MDPLHRYLDFSVRGDFRGIRDSDSSALCMVDTHAHRRFKLSGHLEQCLLSGAHHGEFRQTC